MSDYERNAFANLILLCHPHHTTVDRVERNKYPIELLEKWKSAREAEGQAALAGLREVTEDRLQEMIAGAIEVHNRRIEDALTRFERVDSEAASLLRGLLDELADLRTRKSFLDPDTVNTLYAAAGKLRSINEDTVNTLYRAADRLESLPRMIEGLRDI